MIYVLATFTNDENKQKVLTTQIKSSEYQKLTTHLSNGWKLVANCSTEAQANTLEIGIKINALVDLTQIPGVDLNHIKAELSLLITETIEKS